MWATRLSGKLNGLIAPTIADRLSERERELALAGLGRVHRHHLAGELARLDRGEGVRGHRPAGLDLGGLQRLPGLAADLGGDLVMAAGDSGHDLDEDLGPLVGRERVGHGLLGGVDRGLRLGGAGLGHASDDLTRIGRAHLEPVARLDPFAADQELPFGRRYAHDGEDTPMKVPDVSYARSGDVSIAYQVVGDGPTDLVFLPFLSNLYTLWQFPRFATILRRLAEGRRLIVVNLRGVGLSDRPRGFTIESRMDDLRAVLDAEGCQRPALIGLAEAAATCAVFSASNPDRVERLVLYDPWARGVRDEKERDEALAQIREGRERWGRRDALEGMARELNPQWAEDEEYLEWFVWHHRLTASPATWAEFRRMQIDLDVTDVLPAIRVPTIVISKERTRETATEVARPFLEPSSSSCPVSAEGFSRTTSLSRRSRRSWRARSSASFRRRFSPRSSSPIWWARPSVQRELGDRAWRDLVARHNEVVRRELARFRGVEMDTAGDGFFARFDGPARAIRSGQAIVEGVRGLGLDVRVGVHAGECELHEEKVAGIAVSVGARVAGLAGPGQVLVSSTVRDLVAGSGLDFVEHGTHELKGVPGEWRLFAVGAA